MLFTEFIIGQLDQHRMYKINKTYNIDQLADRFAEKYKTITGASNTGKSKTVIKEPIIQNLNKKTFIKNFSDVCSSINRDSQDVSVFFGTELRAQISIAGDGSLIIHGIYRVNQITSIIKKYVKSYVQCSLCRSQDTKVERSDRILYMVCNKCHAKNAIS